MDPKRKADENVFSADMDETEERPHIKVPLCSRPKRITFTDFQLAPGASPGARGHDFVDVSSRNWASALTIRRYCGSPSLPLVIDHRGYLIVSMKTDADGSGRGFSMTATTKERKCGGMVHFPQITSPDYQVRDYGNNEECIWTIDEDPRFKLNISFRQPFDLEESDKCDKDYVRVGEWLDSRWIKLSDLCGHDVPQAILTRTHRVKITFRSNDAITAAGFGLRYKTVCGSTFEEASGVISSPNYPDAYPLGIVCDFLIQKPGQVIFLTMEDFLLERSDRCMFDSVTIFSGTSNSSDLQRFGPYCGLDDSEGLRPPIGIPFVARDEMLLKFTSDISLNHRGFKARYQILQCGGNLTQDTGLISNF